MRAFVLDTSVAASWYLPDSFSEAAREWQQLLLQGRVRFYVPSLHSWEMANLLRTYVRRETLSEDLAREIYDLHHDAGLDYAEPPRDQVLPTALEYGATAYDAVYIALSFMLDIPVLTAERTTTPWVARLGDRVESVAAS